MNRMKFKIFLFLFVLLQFVNGFGQQFEFYDLKSKEITETQIKEWSKDVKNCVIFFCSDNYDQKLYSEQSEMLKNSKEYMELKEVRTVFVYYPFDSKNNSKNPFLEGTSFASDSILNELVCLIISEDSLHVERSLKNNYANKYEYNRDKAHSYYMVDISKGYICPKDIPSKIILFMDGIVEMFNPHFSTDEKIYKLNSENDELRKEIDTLKYQQEINQEKINELIKEIEGISSTIKSNVDSKSKNKKKE